MLLVAAGLGYQFLTQQSSTTPSQIAFANVSGDSTAESASDYFSNIADAGNNWFEVKIACADDLEKTINAMLLGCDRLIADEHAVLNDTQQQWLVSKCIQWRDRLQKQLDQISQSPDSFESVLPEVNSTIRSLVQQLREKSVNS